MTNNLHELPVLLDEELPIFVECRNAPEPTWKQISLFALDTKYLQVV